MLLSVLSAKPDRNNNLPSAKSAGLLRILEAFPYFSQPRSQIPLIQQPVLSKTSPLYSAATLLNYSIPHQLHTAIIMDSIRSVIQPITHNLPAPIQELGVTILGDEKCYKTLVLDVDFTATECIKLAISKGLGLGIIAASSIVKVPQILKLVSSRSAAGVSFLSYLLETGALLVGLAYNKRQENPFSTYGENALIMAQVSGTLQDEIRNKY